MKIGDAAPAKYPAHTEPRFRVGDPIQIEAYIGVVEKAYNGPIKTKIGIIEGIRFKPHGIWEDSEGNREVTYIGWEYLITLPSGREWGWEPESELIKAGY